MWYSILLVYVIIAKLLAIIALTVASVTVPNYPKFIAGLGVMCLTLAVIINIINYPGWWGVGLGIEVVMATLLLPATYSTFRLIERS